MLRLPIRCIDMFDLRKAVYGSREWARVRRRALERDGYRCRSCGKPGRLEVHHLEKVSRNNQSIWYAIEGLVSLCRGCHFAQPGHKRHRKADWIRFVETPTAMEVNSP